MGPRIFFAGVVLLSFFALVVYYGLEQAQILGPSKVMIAKNEAYNLYEKKDLDKIYKSLVGEGFKRTKDFSDQPYIEKAYLSRSLSGENLITVYLQEPVMAFFHKGVYKLVDKKGAIFSEVPQYRIPDLPIMRGNKFVVQKNRDRAVKLYTTLEKEGLLSQKTLSEVLIDQDLTFIFSGVKGRVFLGEDEVQKRLDRVSKVIRYLRFHGLEAQTFDARFKDRVVVSLNKK